MAAQRLSAQRTGAPGGPPAAAAAAGLRAAASVPRRDPRRPPLPHRAAPPPRSCTQFSRLCAVCLSLVHDVHISQNPGRDQCLKPQTQRTECQRSTS